jgi:methionyl-tRNA formyltransferase
MVLLKKKLILFGSDKISNFYEKKSYNFNNIIIARDNSTNIKRILKLLYKRSLNIKILYKIFYANILRKKIKIKNNIPLINNNKELLKICKKNNVTTLILFKVGLIINSELLNSKIKIINIHCADLPAYAGLGAIYKAIKNKDLKQYSCAHIVHKNIDMGNILHKFKYELSLSKTYLENENVAYKAGFELLKKYLI